LDADGNPNNKLGDGQTECPCEPGWNSGCSAHGDFAKKLICGWKQECHESANKTFSMCITKGNFVCYKYQHLGRSGSIVNAESYSPAEKDSCCEDQACDSRQTCVKIKRGKARTFEYEFDDNGKEGGTLMMTLNVEDVARNGWKNMKGETIKNYPKICIDKVFDATQRTKQYVVPLFSVVVILIAIIHVFDNSREGKLLPLLVLGVSFFLTSSECWSFELLTALVVVATVSTSTAHQGKLVLFLLAYVWLYFGGLNVIFGIFSGSMFGGGWTNLNLEKNYFLLANEKSVPDLATSCSTYFDNYFNLDDRAHWTSDVKHTTSGRCSRGWISFLITIAYVQAYALLLMVTFKVLSFLDLASPTMNKMTMPMKCPPRCPTRGKQTDVKPAEKAPEEAAPAEA